MNIVGDIGGSRMRIASVDAEGVMSSPIIVDTPDNYEEALVLIKESIEELAQGKEVGYFVTGVAGSLARDGAMLLSAPNLPSWVKRPLQKDLMRMSGAKVILKNDTDMTGLGEAIYGAGKGLRIVAYLTFSTGIGGSLIVDGDIGPYNLGYEPGFQLIDIHNDMFLHDVSGAELKKKHGKLFKDIHDKELRKEVLDAVIACIHNTTVYWSPDIVVLGGGMTESFDLQHIKEELEDMRFKLPKLPPIVFATNTDINGLYGGLAYLKKQNEVIQK
jgi:glucokinase